MLDIIQWNIRSIHSNIDNLKLLIEENSPSVVMLQETWLNESHNLRVSGFYSLRQDRSDRGGGIALLVKLDLPFVPIDFSNLLVPDRVQLQGIKVASPLLSIINVYCPPNINLPISFWSNLMDSITTPFMIGGDFNAQNPIWGSGFRNPSGKVLEDFILGEDICILNNGSPTRISPPGENPSAPDITLCSSCLRVNSQWEVISDPGGSDHFPLMTSLCFFPLSSPPSHSRFSSRRFNTAQADWFRFQEVIDNNIRNNRPNSILEFRDLVVEAAEFCIPLRRPFQPSSPTYRKSWWNDDLSLAVKRRSDAFRAYLRNPSMEHFLSAKSIQSAVKAKIRKAKRESFRSFCEGLSPCNGRKLWSDISRFKYGCKPSAPRTSSPTCGQEILSRLCPLSTPATVQSSAPTNYSPAPFPPITLDELSLCIKSKKESAPGKDGITYNMLKSLPIHSKQVLAELFNDQLSSPQIPLSLKDTIIIPICKPGKSPEDPLSFRPIALTSCLLKVLESLLATRLERVYQKSIDDRELQFGFRKGKSVNDALSFLISTIYASFLRNEFVIVVFLDVRQAYDSVQFDLLERTLLSMDLPLSVIELIRSLVVQRNIFLVDPLTKELIGPEQSNIGLAQGSPKAPILFNIFVSDLPNVVNVPGVTTLKFADDKAIIASGPTFDSAFEKMSKALVLVEKWSMAKSLQLSPEKSKALCCHKNKVLPLKPPLRLFKTAIPWADSVKYLGVSIHQNLNWSLHISDMCSKSLQGINVMRALCRTWWGCHPATQLLLYRATIRPFLDYGSLFYGKCSKVLLKKLDRIQYAALRVAMGYMKSTPIPIILAESNELPLKFRRQFLALKFLSKLYRLHNDPVLSKVSSIKHWSTLGNPPPIVEVHSLLSNSEDFYSSSHLPCFDRDLKVHTTHIGYYSLGLSKSSQDNALSFEVACLEKFPNFDRVYTDASKSPSHTGIGIYSPTGISISKRLPNHFSICSAELIAILEATWEIKRRNFKKVLIITDSMSALEKITKWKISASNDHITLAIRDNILYLCNNSCNVKLVWVPSHTNIDGNDKADNLAKTASENSVIRRAHVSEFWPSFKRIIWERWKREWRELMGNRTFSQYVYPRSLGNRPWFLDAELSRGNVVTINRLRSNHCSSPCHLHRIHVAQTDLCACGDRGGIPHIFFNCRVNLSNCLKFCSDLYEVESIKSYPINIYDLIFSENVLVYRLLYNFLVASGIHL